MAAYFERTYDDVDVGCKKSSAQSGHRAPKRVVVNTAIFRQRQGVHSTEEERRSGDQNASAQCQKDVGHVEYSAFLLQIETKPIGTFVIGKNGKNRTLRKMRAKMATKTGTLKMITEASASGMCRKA